MGLRLSEVSHEWIVHDQRAAAAAGQASIDAIERLRWRAIAAILVTFGVTGVLGVLTRRSIVRPIQALDASVNATAAGDYAKAVPFVKASDETGNLARSIDVLKRGASLMDDQRWVKSQVSRITRELQGAVSLSEFGQVLLSRLVPAIGDGVATFYITDAACGDLQRVATYAVADSDAVPERVRLREGLLGQCARERAAVTLTNVPRTYLRAVSVSHEIRTR